MRAFAAAALGLGCCLAASVAPAQNIPGINITWNRELNIVGAAERVISMQRLTGAIPVLTQVTSCYQRANGLKEFNQQLEGCMAMDMAMSFLTTRAAQGGVQNNRQQLPTTGYDDAEKRVRAEFRRVGISSLTDQTRDIQYMAVIVRDTLQEALKQKPR